MKHIYFIFFSFLSVSLYGQATVNGLVVEQNSGNKPLSGVQIKVLGTVPEVSDNSGFFHLEFVTKKPGDRLFVTEISKAGYEIVNIKDIDNWLIPRDNTTHFKVVMCEDGYLAKSAIKYYNISLKEITTGYDQQLNILKDQLSKSKLDAVSFAQKANFLEEQFKIQQERLEELSDRFAHENFDDLSIIQKSAFEAFQNGSIDSAIRILEIVDSKVEIEKAIRQREKGEKIISEENAQLKKLDSIIQQNITKIIFQAQLYVSKYRFEDAEYNFELAVSYNPNNIDNIILFANFLYDQKLYEKASVLYTNAILQALDQDTKSYLLLLLADCETAMNQCIQAKDNYTEAIRIKKKCINSNDRNNLIDLAKYYRNSAYLYRILNKLDSAEWLYREALRVYYAIPNNTSIELRGGVASTLERLASMQRHCNLYDSAIVNFSKSLAIYQDLVIKCPSYYKSELSIMLGNLGFLYYKLNDYGYAKKYYFESYNMLIELTKDNPQKHNPELASLYLNIAHLEQITKDYDSARILYQKSISLFTELSENNPLIYLPELAGALNDLSFLLTQLNYLEDALLFLNKAKNIYKKLPTESFEVYKSDISITINNLATVNERMSKFVQADSNYLEALQLSRELALKNPQVYNPVLANNLNNYGARKMNDLNYQQAEIYLTEALIIRRGLASTNPEVYNPVLSVTLHNMAMLYKKINQPQKAIDYFKEALFIKRKLSEVDPNIYNSSLASTLNNLANIYQELGDKNTAAVLHLEALKIYQELSRSSPRIFNPKIAATLTNYSIDIYKTDIETAIRDITEAKSIYQELFLDDKDYRKQIAFCFSQSAYYQLLTNHLAEAFTLSMQAYELDSTSNKARECIAICYLFQNKYEQSIEIFEQLYHTKIHDVQIFEDLDELEKAGITHPDLAKILEFLKTLKAQ